MFACHWLNHIAVTPTKIPSCTWVKQDKDDFIISHFLTVTNKVAAGIKACGSNVGTLGLKRWYIDPTFETGLVATLLCICLWNYMLTKVYKWPVHIEGLKAKVLLNKEADRAPLNSPFYMHVQEYIHCRCLNIFNNVCIWGIILDC